MAKPGMKRLGRNLGYVLLGLFVLLAVAITFTNRLAAVHWAEIPSSHLTQIRTHPALSLIHI